MTAMSVGDLRVFMSADCVGGVWRYSVDLARGLRARGANVVMAILGPPPTRDQQLEAAGLELILTGLPLDWTAEAPDEVQEASQSLGLLADSLRADIVHLNNPAFAAFGAFRAPVIGVCHSCMATWWQAVRSGPMPTSFQWQADLTQRGYEAADVLLAPTAAFAKATAEFYRLAAPPVVIHNGARVRKTVGEETAEPHVFTAGRLWDDGKNIATIDRIAARIAVPVLAAGDLSGPAGREVTFPHLHLLGRLSSTAMAERLNRRPIFISAAQYEPFGLAVLEAAQAGCPLILSDIPTFRELWEDCAIFVEPTDDGSAASAIENLIQDPILRADMGQRAKQRSARYSLDAMCDSIAKAYRSLLSSKSLSSQNEAAA